MLNHSSAHYLPNEKMLRGVNGNYVMNNFHMSLWLALSYKHFMTNITRVLVLEIWDKVKNFTELNNLPGLQLQLTWFWMGYGFEWVHKLKIIITIKHWTYLYCLTLKWFKYYIQVALRFAKYALRIEPVVKKNFISQILISSYFTNCFTFHVF